MLKTAALIVLLAGAVCAQLPARKIAITIDDLPVVSTRQDIETRRRITKQILSHVKADKIPVIGFVNENKLYTDGKLDERQTDMLKMWLDAGQELGNHTYSHRSLNNIPLADFESEILLGEKVTKGLLAERGKDIRFLRHPYLHTGLTMEIKAGLDEFLAQHGYRIAPITFDNGDYIFARAWDNANDRRQLKLRKRISDAYIPYMRAKLEYWERQSTRLLGRQVSQTLLIHANITTAEHLGELVRMFRKKGYEIVSLEEALRDEAYRQPDTFTGRAGISWLHRWALYKGKEYLEPNEPMVPAFVLKASGFESE